MRQMIRESSRQKARGLGGVDGDEAVESGNGSIPTSHDGHRDAAAFGIDAVKGIMAIDSSACVVMCSALGQETLVQEALQAGARDFIVKPFKPDSVIATLNKVLEKKED